MFKRILIANRGEIAVRIIRACMEMNIECVAIYSTADKESLHVKLATKSICIGPARAADRYLNMQLSQQHKLLAVMLFIQDLDSFLKTLILLENVRKQESLLSDQLLMQWMLWVTKLLLER